MSVSVVHLLVTVSSSLSSFSHMLSSSWKNSGECNFLHSCTHPATLYIPVLGMLAIRLPVMPWLDMLTGGANHQHELSSSYHGNLQAQMAGWGMGTQLWGWGRSAEGTGVRSQREERVARPRVGWAERHMQNLNTC